MIQDLLQKLMERDDIDIEKKGEVYDLLEADDLEGAEALLKELVG